MAYTGYSIVDYLSSIGQASDFASRAKLAAAHGIINYTGTAAQNTQLLGILRNPQPTTATGTMLQGSAPVLQPAPTITSIQPTAPGTSIQNTLPGTVIQPAVAPLVGVNDPGTITMQAGLVPGLASYNAANPPYIPPPAPTSVTGASLAPSPSVNYQAPQDQPVTVTPDTVDSTVPDLALTEQEKRQSDLSKQIQDLTNGLLGQVQYQSEQELAQGLPGLKETQKSISKQILALQADTKNIPEQLQAESVGRNRTIAGIAPLETARLRDNSLKANILGAQLAASQLDVASAEEYVQKALKIKYGPIEEEIKVKKANLQMIIDDPNTSLQDKNRAKKQKEAQDKIEKAEAQNKDTENKIYNILIEAAKNGADAVTQKRIKEAKSPADAIAAAGRFISDQNKSSSSIVGSAATGYLQFNPATGKYDIPVKTGGSTSSGNDPLGIR